MRKVKPLSKEQKLELDKLGPDLKNCVRTANLKRAKILFRNIESILTKTDHYTKVYEYSNWLYECAIENKEYDYAIRGLARTIKLVSPHTRIFLEANALLAIASIRLKNFTKAKEVIYIAVSNVNKIQSKERRIQFHSRLLERLEEECILAGLMNLKHKQLDAEVIQNKAIELIQHNTSDEELYRLIGNEIPKEALALLTNIRSYTCNQISVGDRKYLPPPLKDQQIVEVGKKAKSAIKRVVWRALCDPQDEIYQIWSNNISVVYDQKYITKVVIASLLSMEIASTMIAISVVAFAFKLGAKIFCEIFAPNYIMIRRNE